MQKNNYVFKRIAHRGANREAPENTLEAFCLAIEKYKMDMVEMDIRLTKDGVPVIFHDETIDRVTNGKGAISSLTLKELKTKDAGYWFDPEEKKLFPYRDKGVHIPTLEEALERFPETPFCLQIKGNDVRTAEQVAAVIRRSPHRGPLLAGSFSSKVSRRIRRLAPPCVQGLLYQEEILGLYLSFRLGVGFFQAPARYASLPRKRGGIALDEGRWISFLHKKGVSVFYWTVNETAEIKELLQRGADGIVSDYPERLNQVAGISPP